MLRDLTVLRITFLSHHIVENGALTLPITIPTCLLNSGMFNYPTDLYQLQYRLVIVRIMLMLMINHRLAKFLVPMLQPFAAAQYTVHDSFSSVSEITSISSNSALKLVLMLLAFLPTYLWMSALSCVLRYCLTNVTTSNSINVNLIVYNFGYFLVYLPGIWCPPINMGGKHPTYICLWWISIGSKILV